jgi:hypothetical protein
MATTCELIASTTLGSDAASVTFGSGGTIPQTFTDLFVCYSSRSLRSGQTSDNINIRFNGSSAANYSYRFLQGNSSAASSFNGSAQAQLIVGYSTGASATASTFASGEMYIPNYTGSTTKSISSTCVTENNASTAGAAYVLAFAGLWSLTDAINELQILSNSANFATGSSFYLYGITKA